jgi:type II secretory pathway component GspD/PulD (secretin)
MKMFLLSVSFLLCSLALAQVKVTSDERTNTLIVKAPIALQKQIEQLIYDLDNQNKSKLEIKVIQLVYVQANEVAPLLQNVMNVIKPNQIKNSQMGLNNNIWNSEIHGMILNDDRTNKLIIMSDLNTINNLDKIVKELDKKPNYVNNALVVRLKNTTPQNISDIFNEINKR